MFMGIDPGKDKCGVAVFDGFGRNKISTRRANR